LKIFLLLSLLILAIFLIVKNFFHTAKRNLFKDQAAWSGKDISIKHNRTKKDSDFKSNDNYLKMIADESKLYLEDQLNQEEE